MANLFPARTCLISSLLLVFFFALIDCASAEVQLFKLQHRSAGELAEMARALVSDDAKITAHSNTLIVNAPPEDLAVIDALVADYDKKVQMLRVTIEQGGKNDARSRDLGVSGRLKSGSTAVIIDGTGGHGQNNIFFSSDGGRVAVRGQDSLDRVDRQVNQFMVVMEGAPARISVGRSVPFTSQLRSYWRHHPRYVETIDYKNVDTGFEVLPEVYGDVVELDIRPFMSFLDPKNPQQIVFNEMTTRVRVPFGSWYDLGGTMSNMGGLSQAILQTGSSSEASSARIRVRIDPEG